MIINPRDGKVVIRERINLSASFLGDYIAQLQECTTILDDQKWERDRGR